MQKRPSWFRPLDAAAFLIPVIGITVVTIYAMTVGVEGSNAKGGLALCWVVVAGFIGIWMRLSWLRKRALEAFTWFPTYGFMVYPGGYQVPPAAVFDSSIRKTLQAWSQFHPEAETILTSKVNWVRFEKGLDESAKNPAKLKVEGYTVAVSHSMHVDYDAPDDPLEKTAFEHELGHVIHGFATNKWDMAEHHEFMKKNALK
jgi:hypothetical protein